MKNVIAIYQGLERLLHDGTGNERNVIILYRLSDIVEEGDRRLDPIHALEAGLFPSASSQATPVETPQTERRNTTNQRAQATDKSAEDDAQKLRDFTNGAFTTCQFLSQLVYRYI